MTVFSSLESAIRSGFQWLEYNSELQLHVVLREWTRCDGKKVRALAYARSA